jgi:CheY-like chemotaxis protein
MANDYVFLYVEDDPTSRIVMQMILKHRFASAALTIFEDSTDFETRLQNLPAKPDIIFLDIHMKPHSGFEMLDMIRQHPGYTDCTVIALTASVMNEEIEKLEVSGFDGAIAKPLSRDEFPVLVEKIMGGESIWFVN